MEFAYKNMEFAFENAKFENYIEWPYNFIIGCWHDKVA